MTTPADLYRTCRVSARRLETLQDYDVSGDEERLRAFLAGEPLPPPRPPRPSRARRALEIAWGPIVALVLLSAAGGIAYVLATGQT